MEDILGEKVHREVMAKLNHFVCKSGSALGSSKCGLSKNTVSSVNRGNFTEWGRPIIQFYYAEVYTLTTEAII